MEDRPILEKLAWIAAILGFVYMIWPAKKTDSALPVAPPPVVTTAPTIPPKMFMVGSCNLDTATADGLKKNGLYEEVIHLCTSGKASTVGQSFRIPDIHPDERFQYFNPVEFNNYHGLSDGRVAKAALYQNVSEKISSCFSSSFDEGASPHERIDLEINCLHKNGLKSQDKVYLMLVENARTEGRNVFI